MYINRKSAFFILLALALCVVAASSYAVGRATGHLTMLRIHDVDTGYGPAQDFIDVEVVIRFDSRPGEAFGFQLRNDANSAVRKGMLALLRDAFRTNHEVTVEYYDDPGKTNFVLFRVWMLNP